MKNIIVIGTFDTKYEPLKYLAEQIKKFGGNPILIDVGVAEKSNSVVDISKDEILRSIGSDIDSISKLPRGKAIAKMGEAASVFIKEYLHNDSFQGIIGLGGSGGTTLCSHVMKALPYGIPKIIVSTLASSNTSWYIGISDIVMMPSIVDIAGLNSILKMVLNNAASSIVGMVNHYRPMAEYLSSKKVVSATMYGTTTCGVSRVIGKINEAGYETWVFHASGIGGKTMEELIYQRKIHGVVDMTLAEIGGHLVGGLHDAGTCRLEAAGKIGIPQVIVPGAADTVVLPPIDKVPMEFRNRTLNIHNPNMTTMRTNIEENKKIADFIAEKLNSAKGPVVVILPLKGLSSIDKPGDIFYNPKANAVLFERLKDKLSTSIKVFEIDYHICDKEFSFFVAEKMIDLMKNTYGGVNK